MQAPNILETLRSLFARIHEPTSGILMYVTKMFWAGALGCLFWPQTELGEYGLSVTVTAAAFLACLALPLNLSYFAWDSMPITASRLSLYGLNVAGEVLFLAVLIGTAVGRPEGVEVWHSGLAAGLAIWCSGYSLRVLTFSHFGNILDKSREEDNTPEDVGSK